MAVAEMIKGLPGGQIILGPLIKLREQEKTAAHNSELGRRHEQIQTMLEQSQQIDAKTLEQVLHLEGNVSEVKIMLGLIAPLLNEIGESWHEGRAPRSATSIFEEREHVSKFPLPFDRGLLVRELHALWPDSTALNMFKDALRLASYPANFPSSATSVEYIHGFVNSMVGQSGEVLARVFAELHQQRQGSQILEFVAEYLGSNMSLESKSARRYELPQGESDR
jgi:hypothetical protein